MPKAILTQKKVKQMNDQNKTNLKLLVYSKKQKQKRFEILNLFCRVK